MTQYKCEEVPPCTYFQSAICLHCNRRLCLLHITEHNQIIPSSIQNLLNEVESTSQLINNEYERSRESYNNVLTSLNKWRTQQTEKIQQIYDYHLQSIESQQETLNIIQQNLVELLDRDARQPLKLINNQQNASTGIINHIRETIEKTQKNCVRLKWNFAISPSINVEFDPKIFSSSAMPISMQTPTSSHNPSTQIKSDSSKLASHFVITLRKYRAFRRLVDMFANISAVEQSKEEIASYLKTQGPNFKLPILICSYLTAWYRTAKEDEKSIVLNQHISTIIKHIANLRHGCVTLLGIHAFFYNENIQGNKRDMMTFLLQYFVDHQCISRRQIVNWYNNKELHGYEGFDGVKQLTAPFIKTLWINNTAPDVQTVSTNFTTTEQSDNSKIKEESECFGKTKRVSSTAKLQEEEELVIQNLSWSFNESRDALLDSSFINIPNEITLHLFRFLSVSDLYNVSLVCRSFKMIVDLDDIWKSKCNTSIKLYSKSYKQIYMEWMHEKSLQNQKVQEIKKSLKRTTGHIIHPPPSYPLRPTSTYQFKPVGRFNQHPNSTQELTIDLSVDIDSTAPELISLLKKASHFQQQWQKPSVLKQMIQRYYRFLQLKASHPSNILLIPTLDIEIVWQTHLLRPEMYRNDCLRLFHRIIDHSLIIENDMEQFFKEQAFLDTCQLYKQRFGRKYCLLPSTKGNSEVVSNDFYEPIDHNKTIYSYWDKTHFEFSSNPPSDYENPFSFTERDIILDGKWFDFCREFMSKAIDKVSVDFRFFPRPTEIDLAPGALKRLKKSYERFLYVAAKYPLKDGNRFISPTYAIDIIWHSHMQEPLNYEADCFRLVDYVIYHDLCPTIQDNNMKKSGDQIWKDEFQCKIEIDHLYNTSDNQDNWFG